ncbi:MAG: ATP-binding protein [Candidatus Sumerlaeota bacterium]|nr:ATP-binding protein [Candidatus Sumerlaeota bacterium]
MKPRSFRIRIALLVVALSGLVLVGFGGAALALVYRMRLEALDREIKGRVNPRLTQHEDAQGWADLEKALRFSYGARKEGEVVLWARAPSGAILYQSAEWPVEIQWDSLPSPGPFPDGLAPARDSEPPRDRPLRPQGQKPPPDMRPGARFPIRPPLFITRSVGARRWRIGMMGNPEATLAVATDLTKFDGEMRQTAMAFLIVLPVALLLVAAGGWLIAQRALRPVAALTRTAEQITAKGLDQRIVIGAADTEFLRLITVFNQMMDRLQDSFEQAVRFSADAAHELRTPLTILQGKLESALHEAGDGSPRQQEIGELLEEVQRLKAVTQKLLLLSQVDTGQLHLKMESFDLSAALEEMQEDMRAMAPGLRIEGEVPPGVNVLGDASLLPQVLQNLTSNAIKYTPESGTVVCRLMTDDAKARLSISNSCDGASAPDPNRVFHRFYRGDPSRARRTEGVGLGLSLAREIARAHGGELVLEEARSDQITFTLSLPLAT